jgi:branched-chain amino acid aminotransferase
MKVSERQISIDEVLAAGKNGSLEEILGTGTAAVISAVGELKYNDSLWKAPEWKAGPLAQKLFEEITGIQYGHKEDKFGWIDKL